MPVFIAASQLALAAWIYLLAGHGWYWRTDQRLPGSAGTARQAWPAVVAVVPARDEADILPQTLPTLLGQDYPGALTVLLVDDESSDGTAEVAAKLAEQAGCDNPRSHLVIVPGTPTPKGWAGKVWAMEQGLRAAPGTAPTRGDTVLPGTLSPGDTPDPDGPDPDGPEPPAEFVLFTDADIGYAPGALRGLVQAAESGDLALLSQMALLRAESFWERALIPAFVYFFAQLYPFRRVNRPAGRTAAAAGGCMLVRRQVLDAAGGLARIKGARIDDVALAGLLKRAHGTCWLGFSAQVTSRRPYDRLAAVWDMVARSAYTQLRYSPVTLAATVAGLIWLYLVPVAAALTGLALLAAGAPGWPRGTLAAAGLAAWTIMSVTYLPVLRLSRLSALRAPGLPLIAAAYTAMTITSAWRHHAGRGGEWKGRGLPSGIRDTP